MFGPRSSSSPSSASSHLLAREGLADRPEAEVLQHVGGGDGGGLRHPVALHDGDAAGVEELEDLRRDRRGSGHALTDAAAEERPHFGVELLLRAVESGLQLCRDVASGRPEAAHLHAHLDGAIELVQVLRHGGGEGVDLLEDPRHGGEVGGLDLHEVWHDLLGILLPVGDGPAGVERHELHELGERVRKREEEVDGLVVGPDDVVRDRHVRDVAVVAVADEAALRGRRWCPRCRW